MIQLEAERDLGFWLREHRIAEVKTPKHLRLMQCKQAIAEKGVEVVLTGGISLNPIAVKLKKGYPTAFKQAVLQSRPSPTSLVWIRP